MSRGTARPRIGLALAGGGPLGASYEIGALCALEDALEGIRFTELAHYVGVSAGGFIAAALANGIAPRQLCSQFIASDPRDADSFDPAWLTVPASREFLARAARLPALLASAWWGVTVRRRPLLQVLEQLGAALPTGVFSSEEMHRRLAQLFTRDGRTNDFRRLRAKLTLLATHLDSAEPTPFGRPGWDHVPISRAVQASCALPGLFAPVEIDGSHYVDGALTRTLHACAALEDGLDLLLCVNPLVPFHAADAQAAGAMGGMSLIAAGGLPAVLSQTLRAMLHSRMALGMKHYAQAYPDTDILLFEPDARDAQLHMANTFSYRQRRRIAEVAYQHTLATLRAGRAQHARTLARHGIGLNDEVLAQADRTLVPSPAPRMRLAHATDALGAALDDLARALPAAPARKARA